MSAPPLEEENAADPTPHLGFLGAKEARCRSLVRETENWPKKGTTFLDISPLLCDAAGLHALVEALAERYKGNITHVAGIDARGFTIGCALAHALGVGFIMVRKAGKLPQSEAGRSKLLSAEYELEYGKDRLEVSADILDRAGVETRVLVFDDLIATGGSAIAACNLLRDAGACVHEVACIVELAHLGGRKRVKDEAYVRVHSLLCYDFSSQNCNHNSA